MNTEGKSDIRKTLKILICGSVLFAAISILVMGLAALVPQERFPFGILNAGGTFRYPRTNIGGISLETYYLLYLLGFVSGAFILVVRAEKFGIKFATAIATGICLFIFSVLGAKLMYILEDIRKFRLTGFTLNGVSFFGSVFFMPFFMIPVALLQKKKLGMLLDCCIPTIILMLICVRIGCFTAGCCGGITVSVNAQDVVIPTQLIEIAFDFALLALIVYLEHKGRFVNGLYFIFLGGYGAMRFALEFLRATEKQTLGLSNGQWFALIAVAIMASYCLHFVKRML